MAPSIGTRGRRTSWQAMWWCLGEVDSSRVGDGGRRRRAATPLAACHAGASAGRVACGEEARAEGFRLNPWACGRFGRGRDVWPARWHRRRTAPLLRRVGGRTEEEEIVSGSFVIRPKFQNQFCKLNFSPSSGPQMKMCGIPLLLSFSRSTTFVFCTFSLEQWFESYLIISKNCH